MKFNKEEYENIKIPEQLNSIVQDAIEEGLTTESTGMSDQKPVNIYTRQKKHILRYAGEAVAAMFLIFVVLLNVSPTLQRQQQIRRLSVLCVRYLPSGNMNMRMKPNM